MSNNGNGKIIDEEALARYEKYMENRSNYTRNLENSRRERSANAIAVSSSQKSRRAINSIDRVDSNHISSSQRRHTNSAASYGARISNSPQKTKNGTRYHVNDKTKQKFMKKAKSKLKKWAIIFLVSEGILAYDGHAGLKGLQYIPDLYTFNQLSTDNNVEKGYQLEISQETLDQINQISDQLDNLRNSNIQPTTEELSEVKGNLEDAIDNVTTDLVTKAYNEKYPNRTVTSVKRIYNEYSDDPELTTRCEITYQDEDGKEQTLSISSFSSLGYSFFNHIDKSYTDENKLDDIKLSSLDNLKFDDKDDEILDVLDKYDDVLKDLKQFASNKIVLDKTLVFREPQLKATLPDKIQDNNQETGNSNQTQDLDDDGR